MSAKRHICPGCNRPGSVCLCPALNCLPAPVELIIWQDPVEARHPLSTAPLLQLSIAGSRRCIGDRFSYQDIFAGSPPESVAVVFPFVHKPALTETDFPAIRKLLILDGTWRKVRKILLCNPWLENIHHIALAADTESRYQIRKSPRNDGLSTIEAGVGAVNLLAGDRRFDATLTVLERLVDIQQLNGHKVTADK